VIKRMAIVDGCNVLHLCAGMGLHSRAEQQMFDQKFVLFFGFKNYLTFNF